MCVYPSLTVLYTGVYSVALSLMALHYEALIEELDACPIPAFFGNSETGIIKVAVM